MLLVKVLPPTLAVAAVEEAAAVGLAELLVKVLPPTLAVRRLLTRPPPLSAELAVKVLPTTLAVPPSRCRGRRRWLAELLVKVLPPTLAIPDLSRPPPIGAGGVAGEGAADHRRRPAGLVGEAAAVLAELPVRCRASPSPCR